MSGEGQRPPRFGAVASAHGAAELQPRRPGGARHRRVAGIGHDLVLALAGAGATVAAGVRTATDATALLVEVESRGGRALALDLDVTDVGSIHRAVRKLLEETGRIDVLVNNAGLGANHDAVDITETDWDEMMDVNLRGLFFVTQAVGRAMLARGYGRTSR